ncbi:MAG: DNA-packaging protein [Prevotella sp.]|nr:DNA-packaging protein [Prevotella sp.]
MGKTNKLKYTSAAEMQAAVDAYFTDCEGRPLTDDVGKTVLNKNGSPVIVGAHPPTVTGLALWLGFKTRQSLLNYQHRSDKFNDVLTAAKSRCEEYAERRLFDRDGVNGAKFSLANNFKGWSEKPADSGEGEEVRIIDDI